MEVHLSKLISQNYCVLWGVNVHSEPLWLRRVFVDREPGCCRWYGSERVYLYRSRRRLRFSRPCRSERPVAVRPETLQRTWKRHLKMLLFECQANVNMKNKKKSNDSRSDLIIPSWKPADIMNTYSFLYTCVILTNIPIYFRQQCHTLRGHELKVHCLISSNFCR